MVKLFRGKVFRRSFSGFVLVIFICSLVTSGCEPLRKKFTRKKKEEKKEEFIPVLEPQEYPAPAFNPEAEYKHRYNLWKLWYDDFMVGLDEKGSNKRQSYILGQLIVQLEAMEQLLTGDRQAQLHQYKDTLREIGQLLVLPAALRNTGLIKRKISTIDTKIHDQFSPRQIQDTFAQ